MGGVRDNMTVIDVDGHIVEDLNDLREFMDPRIQWITRPNRPFPSAIGAFPNLDGLHSFMGAAEGGMIPKPRPRVDASDHRPGSPEDWVAALDKTGIAHAVLVTSDGLGIGNHRGREYLRLLCRAYNDYVATSYARHDPRLHPYALIPMQHPDDAVAELRRAVKELGLVGAMVPSTGLPLHAGHEYFWPVYKEASDLECVLAFHGGSNRGIGLDSFSNLTASHILHHPSALMIAFVAMVYDGVFERFPTMRAAFLEGGCGWIAFLLDRVDREAELPQPDYDGYRHNMPRKLFESGRVMVGCEGNDGIIPYLAKTIGVGSLGFSSDYPHEADFVDVNREIEETLEGDELSDTDKRAILGENALKFFRF